MKSMLKSLMSVAAAALAFTSCTKDATEDVMPNGGSKTLVVNATIDQTRTVMATNHVDLDWTDDDEIYLYIGSEAAKADAKKINAKTGGKITGVTYEDGKTVVYANYSLDNEQYSDGVTKAEIKIISNQKQTKANVFAGENLPMVASGEIKGGRVDLVFQPVGCVLVFNVYGPAANEKIKSIKFTTTSERCYGYKKCNLTAGLTAEALNFKDSSLEGGGKSVTVTLDSPATIGTAKPTDTKKDENQVYMVVAPFNYTAATFTVTTESGKKYTFTTKNGINCSQNTACVVNLNLAKSAELKPEIIVPTSVDEQSSAGGDAYIEGIQFNNITTEQIDQATISVYGNAELTQTVDWITFGNNVTAVLSTGTLNYNLAANGNVTDRTAYIVIECAGVKSPAIAITQLAKGKLVTTYVPANMSYTDEDAVPSHATLDNGAVTLTFDKGNHSSGLSPKYYVPVVRCYKENTVTVTSSTSKILKIEVVRGKNNSSKLSVNDSSLPNNNNTFTWTGESNNVVLTVKGDTFHLESMKITYGEDNEPRIEVPTVEKQPAAGGEFPISNIVFKNIDLTNTTVDVYSDKDLTQQENVAWLTISNPTATLENGVLNCVVAANTGAERTAYIGIKCVEGAQVIAQAAIAVTQRAQGAVDKYFVKVTENLTDWSGDYLIVYEAGNKAFNGGLEGSSINGSKNIIGVTITGQGILSEDATNAALVKITKKDGATDEYMLQTASTYYLYSSSSGETDIMRSTSKETAAGHPHSISISNSSAKITSKTSSRFLAFNTSTSTFKYYKSGMGSVQLYKLQE